MKFGQNKKNQILGTVLQKVTEKKAGNKFETMFHQKLH